MPGTLFAGKASGRLMSGVNQAVAARIWDQPRTDPVGISWWLLVSLGLGSLALLSLCLRPLLPVDETRYLSVAWEMWQHGSFVLPVLNGEAYAHKPPLLFWLIHAGWALTGVNSWWPRAIGPLAALLGLWLLKRLGQRLWPAHPSIGRNASLLLLGTWFYALYQPAVMFDLPVLATVVGAWLALHAAVCSGRRSRWLLFGLIVGLGLLLKGPVVWVYELPLLLLARWWRPPGSPPISFGSVMLAVALAAALPAAWLGMVSLQGSETYLHGLLLDQTLDRVRGVMGHPRPWYWYLPILLLLPMPWTLCPHAWQGWRAFLTERGQCSHRFVLAGLVPPLLVLSLISGKQVHYLLPLLAMSQLALSRGLQLVHPRIGLMSALPSLLVLCLLAGWGVHVAASGTVSGPAAWLIECLPALLAALLVWPLALWLRRRQAAHAEVPVLSLAAVVVCVGLSLAVLPTVAPKLDLEPVALAVARAQADGRAVLYVGNYQGEFGFLGRLREPVQSLPVDAAQPWLSAHPDGLVVVRAKRLNGSGALLPEGQQDFKSDRMLWFRAGDLLEHRADFRAPLHEVY